MMTQAARDASELHLALAIPATVNPQEVARRKQALLDSGACDGRTLTGAMLAEQIALQAATEQAKVDARERAKIVRMMEEAQRRDGELQEVLSRSEGIKPAGDASHPSEQMSALEREPTGGITPPHPVTVGEQVVLDHARASEASR